MSEVIKKEPQSVAIVSQSGRGKTMSARHMDGDTTGFINAEDKPLPFPNHFKNYVRTSSAPEMLNKLVEFGKDPKITEVFFDSFSGYSDAVYKTAKATKKGYDIYSYYNEEIAKFLSLIKRYPKDIFVTAHYEMVNVDGDGLTEKRIFVRGKEWAGEQHCRRKSYLIAGTPDRVMPKTISSQDFVRSKVQRLSRKGVLLAASSHYWEKVAILY